MVAKGVPQVLLATPPFPTDQERDQEVFFGDTEVHLGGETFVRAPGQRHFPAKNVGQLFTPFKEVPTTKLPCTTYT